MEKDWTPTKLECEIAAAVLQEYSENPRLFRVGWAARFLDDLFPRVASYYDEVEETLAEEGLGNWSFSYKQHHSFWNVITHFRWRSLLKYRQVIDTIHALQQSMKATYDSRWMEEEAKQIRRRFDELAAEAFKQLVILRSSDGNAELDQ